MTSIGRFTATLNGTYINEYEYQNEKNGPFVQNVGTYADNGPVFRWKHNLGVQWSEGAWGATLVNTYMSGYHDQNNVAPKYFNNVPTYSIWGVSGSYSGFKNLTLIAGVKNLLNTDPPFSNQGNTFQQGYDPRFTDALGRTLYVSANYKFK
jgi:iron complex outermembrane receptor protein